MSDVVPADIARAYPAFWQAARAGRLELQCCAHCRRFRYFPAPLCPQCLSTEYEWQPVSGEGLLYAFTTVHRAPNAAMAKEIPYTIAFVDLAEGPRVMARLDHIPPEGPVIGTPVTFDGVGDGSVGPWLCFRCNTADG
jgi:uncharacterized OB-fold protein